MMVLYLKLLAPIIMLYEVYIGVTPMRNRILIVSKKMMFIIESE